MKVAITGAGGLLGHGLVEIFSSHHTVFPLTRADADITQADKLGEVFRKLAPEIVIHSAGMRDLDPCELDPAKAFLVNYHGTRHVAEAAHDAGARVVYISTDAVFDGKKQTPYTESDPTVPPTVYGRTKLRAERAVRGTPESWVFRVSVLFGPGRTNVIDQALRKIGRGEEHEVAADQLGSATYTLDAARKIMEVVETRRYGLYHLSNSGACSRLELARRAAELRGLDPNKIVGKPSAEMGRPAVRLKYAVMAMDALERAGFAPPRPWQDALADYTGSLPPLR